MNPINFRTLDLNLLRVFNEVMAEHSLTRAAHNLAMTQPAISNALRRLRELLGDDLVRRSGYGVEPTPAAQALWPAIREALAQIQESLAPDTFDPATARNTFVLAMADATAAELIPGLIGALEREAPGASIRVVPLATRDPRRLLENEAIDLAVGYFPIVLTELATLAQTGANPTYQYQRLYDGEYACVMRRGHHLARRKIDLDTYCAARHLLVSFSGRPFGVVDQALASLGRRRRVVMTVNQFFTAGQVVAHSDLLTILPRHFVRVTGIADQLVLRDLPLEVPKVHVDALWHRRSHQRSAHEWLRQAVADSATQAFASRKIDP